MLSRFLSACSLHWLYLTSASVYFLSVPTIRNTCLSNLIPNLILNIICKRLVFQITNFISALDEIELF